MVLPPQLGPYRLIRRLGFGGMSEVHLARVVGASGFEKLVAIKTLLPELRGDGDFERLLLDEAKLGARLSHRNLVQVHDLGVQDGVYYVRMDWVDGADLASVRRARTLSIELSLMVAEELALALEYVHGLTDESGRPLGLVHRDVSPSNVLLSRSGEVKLSDFGIAKATLLAETTRASIRRGKYAYMSPEQIAGEPLTRRSDQFGFGVLLMELVCGRRPFDGASPVETMDRIRAARPPSLPDVDEDLASIVLRCLARDAEARFEGAGELRRAVAAARRRRAPVGPGDLGACVCGALAPAPERESRPRPMTRPLTD